MTEKVSERSLFDLLGHHSGLFFIDGVEQLCFLVIKCTQVIGSRGERPFAGSFSFSLVVDYSTSTDGTVSVRLATQRQC